MVNNNAAATSIVLGTLARGKEVIVSRGQLVEIGGSFRLPEVMEKSGVRLVEVAPLRVEDAGVVVNPIVPPAVPAEGSLIRVSMMASLSEDDIGEALSRFGTVGRELGVI